MKPRRHNFTISDIIQGTSLIHRVCLRQTFNELMTRPGAKYWKHLVIRDVPWPFVNNIPIWFLDKYPTDFKIEYSPEGCSLLKCYHDVYCKGDTAVQINGQEIFGCGDGCLGMYREFFDYLNEKYDVACPDSRTVEKPFYFDTLNIAGKNEHYCGLEMTGLKTFALRPSSRWAPKRSEKTTTRTPVDRAYLKQYSLKHPTKWRQAAGLVDSPPLTWNAGTQNVNFNAEYCARFRKRYDEKNDVCFTTASRKMLNFVVGEHAMDQVPLGKNWIFTPGLQLLKALRQFQHHIDVGHTVKPIDDAQRQGAWTHPRKIRRVHKRQKIFDFEAIVKRCSKDFNVLDFFTHFAENVAAVEAVHRAPALVSHLLRYFSENVLREFLKSMSYVSSEQLYVRLVLMVVQSSLVQFGVDVALEFLACMSSTISGVFMVNVLFLPLELMMSVMNVGGYNNELTHAAIDARRRILQDNLVKRSVPLAQEFLVLSPGPYVTPHITPEIMYHVALSTYYKQFPECAKTVREKSSKQELTLIEEYLSHMTHNSLGQRINIGPTEKMPDQQKTEKLIDETIKQGKTYTLERALAITIEDTILFVTAMFVLLFGLIYLLISRRSPSWGLMLLVLSSWLFGMWGAKSDFANDPIDSI